MPLTMLLFNIVADEATDGMPLLLQSDLRQNIQDNLSSSFFKTPASQVDLKFLFTSIRSLLIRKKASLCTLSLVVRVTAMTTGLNLIQGSIKPYKQMLLSDLPSHLYNHLLFI